MSSMRISVTVVPNARSASVVRIADATYRVRVDAKALDGKANERLIEILAGHFSTKKSSVRIVAGLGSRKKSVEIIVP